MTTTSEFEKWSYFFGMKEESLIVEALVRGVCLRPQLIAAWTIEHSISDFFHIVFLRHELALQRNHVGTFHSCAHAGKQYSPGQRHQHERKLHAYGCVGLDHLP